MIKLFWNKSNPYLLHETFNILPLGEKSFKKELCLAQRNKCLLDEQINVCLYNNHI